MNHKCCQSAQYDLVCFVVCAFIYFVLLIVLKGIREDELEDMPGGRIVIALAEKVHLM